MLDVEELVKKHIAALELRVTAKIMRMIADGMEKGADSLVETTHMNPVEQDEEQFKFPTRKGQ